MLILGVVVVLGLGVLCLGAVGALIFGWFPMESNPLASLLKPASPAPAAAASLTPVTIQASATAMPLPADTPVPQNTPAPAALPTWTSTAVQQGGARDLHEFSDDFSTADNSWKIVSDQSNGSFTIENGVLDMTVVKPDKYLSLQVPWYLTQPVSDVVLSMTVTVQTPGLGAFGFFCRAVDSKNFYMVSLLPDARGGGEYRFYKDVNGQITHLTDWKPTDLLYGGEVPEEVSLSCKDTRLRLFINGKFVDEITDSSHAAGAAHIFAVSLADVSADNPYRITVDDFKAVIP